MRLYRPIYMGGLSEWSYEIYLSDGGDLKPKYIDTVEILNATSNFTIRLTKDFINGLGSIRNVYYVSVNMKIINTSLAGIVALPEYYSPPLAIKMICTLNGKTNCLLSLW